MTKAKFATREEWLMAATEKMRPWFKKAGEPIPEKLRVSCGWPTRKALSGRGGSHTIGQCFSTACSADKLSELFISPCLGDAIKALETLVHELAHAAQDCKTGHGPAFRKLAVALGLEGKMTATVAGEELKKRLHAMVEELGDYPHAALNPAVQQKKQGTRMLKATCCGCGYVVRLTRKWSDVGMPTCCCGGMMELEENEEGGDE